MSLTLHYHPLSSYCWKALIGLYELEIPFDKHLVDLSDEAARAAFVRLWPIGKFPVLRDEGRGRTVPESTIVLEYADSLGSGHARLIPTDPERALACRLRDRLYDLYIHLPLQKIVGDRLRPEGQRDPLGVEHARAQMETAYALADEQVGARPRGRSARSSRWPTAPRCRRSTTARRSLPSRAAGRTSPRTSSACRAGLRSRACWKRRGRICTCFRGDRLARRVEDVAGSSSIPVEPRLEPELPQRILAGALGGSLLLALVTAVTIEVSVPMPAAGLRLRVLHHLFDAAETLGFGLLVGAVGAATVRLLRVQGRLLYAITLVAAAIVVWEVVGDYLVLQVSHGRGAKVAPLVVATAVFLATFELAAAARIPRAFARRPRHARVPLLVALALLVADEVPLRDDYFGIHGLVALAAAILAGSGAVEGVHPAARGAESERARAQAAALLALGALVAVFGLCVPPPNDVRCELFRRPCAVAAWALASTALAHAVAARCRRAARVALATRPLARASDRVFTTPSPRLPVAPVVVLVTIDALRGDVALDPGNISRYPTLAAMKKDGVVFTHASSAGTQTPVSVATMFSSLYFSEQIWRTYGEGGDRFPYPATDSSPRVPELLARHGVATVQESAYVFLAGDFGVCRGFTEERVFGRTSAAAPAKQLVERARRAARRARGRRASFRLRAPGRSARAVRRGARGDDYERYLSAIAVADAQLGRVRDLLRRRFGDRWALIVSADHGESFGSHGTFQHAKTLYEELVHVPLLFESPRFVGRGIEARVGLVDVGPTLLDLFRIPIPATFEGQSLVPLLTGGDVAFTRPLFAEARLERSFTGQDGFKVIVDPRRKTVEAYDLAVDPLETRNVFDSEPARADRGLAEIEAFFGARTRRDGGYEPPYKP